MSSDSSLPDESLSQPTGNRRQSADEIPNKRVEPLELFFDLVFVFAITQVTARMAADPTWDGLLRSLLVLTVIWWAWGAYAWLTNEIDTGLVMVRVVFFASMAAMFVCALAVPGAFGEDAWIFAAGYLIVRILHIALFAAGTTHVDVRQAAVALAPTALLAPLILLGAAAFDGVAQVALWLVVIAIDYVGGGLRGIEGWHLSPSHFAERHGLIIIIALGESIVATGVGAEGVALDAGTITAAVLGIVVVAVLWATYFDQSPDRVEHRLQSLAGRNRNTMARDAYSFLHLPMVAAIVLLALGMKKTLAHIDYELATVPAVSVCCGVALYFVAQYLYLWRCHERPGVQRLIAALCCAALTFAAVQIAAIATIGFLAGILAALMAYEILSPRAQLRDGR